jgi:hypothetical protein
MGIWPVIVWEEEYRDDPIRLAVGDRVSWDVKLIDGEAGAWPTGLLVSTTVEIVERSPESAFARTPELVAVWRGTAPVGARFALHAALVADWLQPTGTAVAGTIRWMSKVWVAAELVPVAAGRSAFRRVQPVTRRHLVEVRELDRLPLGDTDGEVIDALLVGLDVDTNEVAGELP